MAKERKIGYKVLSAAVFIGMEIAALSMLHNSGRLQDIWLSRTSHRIVAAVWGGCDNIRHYFSLGKENEALALENFELMQSVRRYQDLVNAATEKGLTDSLNVTPGFEYVAADIVKVSRNKQHNYFILDKGYEDGVRPQSGVITSKGVVGIIDAVDKHYSYGLSLMNTGVNISSRLGTEGAVGPLTWDGVSTRGAILKEIPLQYKFAPGDTVWTSGYSSLFPADIPLGVTGDSKVVNGAVNEIEVTLFQDFSSLKYVTIVTSTGREEILYLENLENGEEAEQ